MAHYALLDENNIVVEVITGVDENITQTDLDGTQVGGSTEAWETFYGNYKGMGCKRTSYNSLGNKRPNPETGLFTESGAFRKNYAGIGYTYDASRDAFIPPKPYNSWTLDEETCVWEAPTPLPDSENPYSWNEETLTWDLVS